VPHLAAGVEAPEVSRLQRADGRGQGVSGRQGDLFAEPRRSPRPYFDGPSDEPDRDERLGRQLDDIRALMRDGQWRTLAQIETATGHPPASISAQLRHLRKPRFGAHVVNKRHIGHGLYEYQVLLQ